MTLSYTWGSHGSARQIVCNGIPYKVTQNIFDALLALRHPGKKTRFLWIDAICINQSDTDEKAAQVRNMLLIYKKAATVIAWVGTDIVPMADVFLAYINVGFDFRRLCDGLQYLYTRPWFRRMWVQQEIFGTRILKLQCGPHKFEWFSVLSEPKVLLTATHLQPYEKAYESAMKKGKNLEKVFPMNIAASYNTITQLDQLRNQNLTSFERFWREKSPQLDFIETLLDTGRLNVTDPKDYIYGILGTSRIVC